MNKIAILILSGAMGTLTRYYLSGFIYQIFGERFPYGTMFVNVLGCFLIGFCGALAEKKFLLDANLRLFLMVGFLGSFTTFSTFMFETANLVRDEQLVSALLNVAISLGVGFLTFKAGMVMAELI